MLLDAISKKPGRSHLADMSARMGDCAGSCMGLYNYVRENFPEKRDRCLSGRASGIH